jgi:glutamate/aspartate transport system substrate-binding protein
MIRIVALFILTVFAAGAVHAQALEGRLKRIVETSTIAIAYRADAVPFSFVNDKNQPDGFAIDLCKRIVNSIERQLNVLGLKVNWVPVTVQTRFEAVAKGRADMECGSSTMTLTRMKEVDFSSVIFVETTGLLTKTTSGVRSISDMSGKKVAVVGGTTNERAINVQFKRRQLNATVLPFKSRDEALAALEEGKADAFASDKLLLLGAATKAKDPRALTILGDQLSMEPYGIVLPRGDAAFRLAVNTGLAQIYAGEEIVEIFRRWFGALGRPSAILEAAYSLGAIPE